MGIATALAARFPTNGEWWGERPRFFAKTVPKFNVRIILRSLCSGGVIGLIDADIGE
jgi:hypothetical protein